MPRFNVKRFTEILLSHPRLLSGVFSHSLVILVFFQVHPHHPLQAWIWSGVMTLQLFIRMATDLWKSSVAFGSRSGNSAFMTDVRITVGWTIGSIMVFQMGQPHTLPLLYVTLMVGVSLQVWRRPGASIQRSVIHLLPLLSLVIQLLWTQKEHPERLSLALVFVGWGLMLLYTQQHLRRTRLKHLDEQQQQQLALQQLQEAHDLLLQRNERLQHSRKRLQQALKSTQRMASTDALTGCLNRRGLFNQLKQQLDPLTSHGAFLMLDLDHFKKINDLHGHPFGDLVLKTMVDRIEMLLGSRAVVARYGGEEFLCVIPGASLEEARTTAEHLRQMVACAPVTDETHLQWVTVSIGVALFHPGEDLQTAIQRADQAMYQAKNSGRNQVRVMASPALSRLRTVPPGAP